MKQRCGIARHGMPVDGNAAGQPDDAPGTALDTPLAEARSSG
jgi:hypothetical protein